MTKQVPIVAIVGRTNVGKSTLFNALCGRRIAVVEDVAGVTRDRNYALIERFEFPFTLVDTGGLVGEEEHQLHAAVRIQSELAIVEADVVVCVFDGLHGVHPLDAGVCEILRKSRKPVIWVANKCESPKTVSDCQELYSLGIDDFLCISAEHNVGIDDLLTRIGDAVSSEKFSKVTEEEVESIQVAILGRPNVGKSSLVNRICGESRLVTSELSGTTTDTIDIVLTREGQSFILLDTAGLRKKAKVYDSTVERYSNLRALRALARCDVVVIVLDATRGVPSEQDAKIAGLAHDRGRGLVIVVNKWDAVEKPHTAVKEYTDTIRREFKFAAYAPILFVSALTGRRCPSVLETARRIHEESKKRVSTSDVNRLLKLAFDKKPAPRYKHSAVKLFYATQVDCSPPRFALFLNYPRKLNFSYQRYLKNAIREAYGFEGSDIKLSLRKREGEQQSS